jgi:hypothetical protein
MSLEHPVGIRQPTLVAEGHFFSAVNTARTRHPNRGLEPHALVDVLADIADGLRSLATGVRATYILLDEVREMLRRLAASRS